MTSFASVAAFLTGFFPPLSIAASNAALFLLAAAAAAAHLRGGEKFSWRRTPFDIAVLSFLSAWAIASLLGMDPGKSLKTFLSQARFIVFYLLVFACGGRLRRDALKGYLAGAGVLIFWGYGQAIWGWIDGGGRFPGFLQALGEQGTYYFSLKSGRIHGPFHPLTYAEVLLPSFFFATAYFLEAEGRRELLRRAAWPLAAGGALLLSQGRGPWLGAAAGVAVLAAVHPRRWRLLGPGLALAAALLAHPELRSRLTSMQGGVPDQARSHRLILWHNTWEVAKRNWLTGVGPGNLEAAVDSHQGEPDFLPNPLKMTGDAHNQYLHYLAERGLPGLAVFFFLIATPVFLAFRTLRGPPGEDPLPRWVLFGLAAFFVSFCVPNITERVFDDAEPALVFWVLAALLAGALRKPSPGAASGVPGRSGDALKK